MPSILEVLAQRAPSEHVSKATRKVEPDALAASLSAARTALAEKKNDSSVPSVVAKPKVFAKKVSKKGPLEVQSSRRQYDVSGLALKRKRNDIDDGKAKHVVGDPRFSDLCGTLDVSAVGRNYGFIDEYRNSEKGQLMKRRGELLRAGGAKAKEEADKLKVEFQKMEKEDGKRQILGREADMKKRLMEKEKEAIVKSGGAKQVYHYSEAMIRREVKKEMDGEMGGKKREKRDAKREKRKAGKEKKGMVKRVA